MDTSIFKAEYNDDEKKNIMFENIAKMIYNRNIVTTNSEIENDFKKNFDNDTTNYKTKDIKIAVKFLLRRITTIRKVEDIEDFLSKYKDYYKFIIVSKITPKVYKQFLEYPNLEVFFDDDFLINKVDNIFVPKHIVLTPEEQQQLKDEYGFNRNEIGKIKQSDPIARYYNLKPGEIIAIERASRTSGISMYYRICIPASLL